MFVGFVNEGMFWFWRIYEMLKGAAELYTSSSLLLYIVFFPLYFIFNQCINVELISVLLVIA